MSDDLISRSALLESVNYYYTHTPNDSPEHYAYGVALKEIREHPTAFDKKRVIEKIKDESREERLEDVSISGNVYGYNIERVINEEDVIEIVEKGGIE